MIPLETVGVVVAALGGAAVGLERQWSGHAEGPSARFAGIRTFTLLGIVAGLSGWLSAAGFLPAATVLLAGAVAITVAGYVAASRQDVDGTTEVAALVVLAAGVLAGILPAPDTASPTNPFIASSETGSSRAVHLPRAPIRSSRIGHIRTSPSIWRCIDCYRCVRIWNELQVRGHKAIRDAHARRGVRRRLDWLALRAISSRPELRRQCGDHQ